MVPAVHVGHHGRSGTISFVTEQGAVKARSFGRVSEAERWLTTELDKVKGVPWDMKATFEPSAPPAVRGEVAEGMPIAPKPLSGEMAPPPRRKMYITAADV
eukprot:3410029-Karenia_brevis.AAC.1